MPLGPASWKCTPWTTRSALVALLGFPVAAWSAEVRLPAPGTGDWRPLQIPRVDRQTEYLPRPDGDRQAVRAHSRCSASALALPLDDVDLDRTPRLRWWWRIEQGLDIPDERVKQGDDFAARVYVLFPFDPEGASLFQRLRHRLGERLFGAELPGGALNYVWTSHLPAGTRWDNPFAAESKMISLGRGPLVEWQAAEIDVGRDRELLGARPRAPLALALMTDSDNSCQEAVAWFADFRFVSPAARPAAPSPSGP